VQAKVQEGRNDRAGAVFVQTNEADNRVLMIPRGEDGALGEPTEYRTGGAGSATPHLTSQGSVILSRDRGFLLVANTASHQVSVFRVDGTRLERIAVVDTAGDAPRSLAERDGIVYVLNTGKAAVVSFRLSATEAGAMVETETALSSADADPAQIGLSPDGRTLIVTERGTDSIEVFPVRDDGSLGEPTVIASSGQTPYGFVFASHGALVVTEAFGARKGAAAASSYGSTGGSLTPMTRSLANGMSEICWAVVTPDDRFIFTTNFADSTVSRFAVSPDGGLTLDDAAAASLGESRPGLRDEDLTDDGRYLYAIDADGGAVIGWRVGDDGSLTKIASRDGLPRTIAGLAAI